jgi:hypothetical protein
MIICDQNTEYHEGFEPDFIFEACLDDLECIRKKINKMSKLELSVLGTTVNAAFVDEIIGNKIEFFVDENCSINKKYFRGKPVYHPSKLNQNNLTVIPYQGDSGMRIKDRFIKTYNGNFEVL